MRQIPAGLALASCLVVAACNPMQASGDPAVSVYAMAETAPVGTADEDAADDPAIWFNPANPDRSLIVATDKKAGLYLYGMDGKALHFIDRPGLNNVDLVEMEDGQIVVFASDRSDLENAKIALFVLDTRARLLRSLGTVASGNGEAYGICGYSHGGELIVYTAPKEGNIGEWKISLDGEAAGAELLREMTVPSQPEGCAIDPRTGDLFIGEEAAGIWRFKAEQTTGEIVAPVDNKMLVADLEGLALLPEGENGGYLVASSQGDNAYAVYTLPELTPVGRFRIAKGMIGSTEETDGIALDGNNFGTNYPQGLFVAQDGDNGRFAQNFKLVSWAEILKALAN